MKSCVTIKKKDLKAYFSTCSDPQICPRGKIFAPLYSTLHYLRFDMQQDYVCTKWILTHRGHTPWPYPKGSHQNSECAPPVLIHRAVACGSFENPAYPLVLPPRGHIKIPNLFLQFSSIGLLPLTVLRF